MRLVVTLSRALVSMPEKQLGSVAPFFHSTEVGRSRNTCVTYNVYLLATVRADSFFCERFLNHPERVYTYGSRHLALLKMRLLTLFATQVDHSGLRGRVA